ncbi:MAG: OmpA family protein [Bacteroidetes bacterium]|nr:OmpA family protein [Bacteroidota bacterium]
MRTTLILSIFLLFTQQLLSQEKEYNDGRGGKVKLPLGDLSFADKVVDFKIGTPTPIAANSKAIDAVGIPNFNQLEISGFVSLGGGGELTLAFTDNALVNIDGPDLYIFEMGKYVEETYLYVSKDARKWISVGKISGGNALVDIGDSTKIGEIFTYVKLVDAKSLTKDKSWPGADIDAVAAIGSAKQLSLNALYLFNTNESKIKPAAKTDLDKIVSELKANPNYDVVINGHTDSIGNKKLNQKLSLDRANSIKTYILTKAPTLKAKIKFQTNGYAEEYPVATNNTPEGREKNRRVEVFFIPTKK